MIRPVQIGNLIIDLLDELKVAISNKLSFNMMELAILNENISGYSLTFLMNEGSGLVEQF